MTNGRILIVEKDAIVAWDLTESLELGGYEVCCVSNGAAALRQARKFRPELAIVDLDVTGALDPAGLAHLLYEEHGSCVVYLTAFPYQERPPWLAAAWPLAFAEKPIDTSKLHAKAAEAIAMHRARRSVALSIVPANLANGCLCSPARVAALVPLTQ
jgi:DNA-binding NtrC family response regulator